ncbi:MAG: DUF2812 domain-containing protein [Solirubrobacterales bacterium]
MVKFKLYFDKDKEEVWLKEMAEQGWALDKFFLGFYTFKECAPGEYNYQIDLLDNWSGDKREFAAFMEESGVEVISQWYRWVYLRKKSVEGPFEMYTDIESKISQYSRIRKFFLVGLIIETLCFCEEVYLTFMTGSGGMIYLDFIIVIFVLIFLRMVWKCNWKIEELKRNKL